MSEQKEKNIQIPLSLFLNCFKLLVCDVGSPELYEDTKNALQTKFEAIARRELYTKYKTAKTDEEREQARQQYLDSAGIPQEYRWSEEWKGE
ncbi:MAG: complexin-2 [Firmicutes bacterium]|nr:complexin-2 [Bacillota bacterium]MBR1441919.1 complexin-2 [Bacillota bacterium]